MIHDVDEALRSLIKREALDGADVEVVLDAPKKDWAARCTAPTIDLYLYDIREVASRRRTGMVEVRDEDGRITARKPFPRVFRLSYLLTAWTQRPEDEHRLLTLVLGCFLRHESFPADLLSKVLAASIEPPKISIAQAPPQDRQISEVWSALGGELKASLDLSVIASIETGVIERAAGLVREVPRFTLSDPAGRSEEAGRRRELPPELGRPQVVAGVWHDDGDGELVHGGKDPEPGRSVRIRSMPRR
ncbi:MAG: DUF4255 domain-containing protein [Acidimicrobiales bacterium]